MTHNLKLISRYLSELYRVVNYKCRTFTRIFRNESLDESKREIVPFKVFSGAIQYMNLQSGKPLLRIFVAGPANLTQKITSKKLTQKSAIFGSFLDLFRPF